MKDLNYYKTNAEEDYTTTPISVLKYITELESKLFSSSLPKERVVVGTKEVTVKELVTVVKRSLDPYATDLECFVLVLEELLDKK